MICERGTSYKQTTPVKPVHLFVQPESELSIRLINRSDLDELYTTKIAYAKRKVAYAKRKIAIAKQKNRSEDRTKRRRTLISNPCERYESVNKGFEINFLFREERGPVLAV